MSDPGGDWLLIIASHGEWFSILSDRAKELTVPRKRTYAEAVTDLYGVAVGSRLRVRRTGERVTVRDIYIQSEGVFIDILLKIEREDGNLYGIYRTALHHLEKDTPPDTPGASGQSQQSS